MTDVIERTDLSEAIDFDAEVPCDLMVDHACPNPGEWIAVLSCGPISPPTCTAHMEWIKDKIDRILGFHCVCIHGHRHRMSELTWRRI